MFDIPKEMPDDLPFVKPEDYQYFAKLLDEKKDEELSADEVRRVPGRGFFFAFGSKNVANTAMAFLCTERPDMQVKERKIMRLMLKIKNGTPPMRKVALRQITDKAREFGPGPLFNQILPLLMSPSVRLALCGPARAGRKPDPPTKGRWRLPSRERPHFPSWRTKSAT